jgi:N utilization substance protein A
MVNIGNAISNTEILQIIESVAREKTISKDGLFSALEQAIQTAGRRKYGNEHNIKAEISRKNGEIRLFKVLTVVESVENYLQQISLKDAAIQNPGVKIGDEVYEILPPIDLGRASAQAAKQVITRAVTEIEKEKQYNDFKNRKGDILNGVVKRLEFGNLIVDLGRAEAIIKHGHLLPNEKYKVGDRLKAYVQDVRLEYHGPQIFLSRTDDGMLLKLLELEVPEIYEKVVEVKAVARDPGSKTKVAVFAADTSIDAIGACVGIRGNRIKAVTNELAGEKVDVVLWNSNVAQFVINAMSPAKIAKIVIDQDNWRVQVVVPDDQFSIAIGRRGQNVRLASKLTGWGIDVITEEQESKRRIDDFRSTTELFVKTLEVEETIGQLLSVEGFNTIEQIADTEIETLNAIEGFDQDISAEIKNRALQYVQEKNHKIIDKLEALGVEQSLLDVLYVQPEDILKLAEYGVKSIEDLSEITVQEFKTLVPNSGLSDNDIKLLLTNTRE